MKNYHKQALILGNDGPYLKPCILVTNMRLTYFTIESFQEMVSVESFIDLVKKRDIGRLKFAIRETNFDIDSRDEVRYLNCI